MDTPSTHSHEVHLAIYDLSNGMARGLSAQFLGPQHAIEIIPHTAILAYGKEYFFGQGIQSMQPREFRATRGLQPIELQPLGRTSCTEQEFEAWCRAQAANGTFGPQSYDLLTRNCNNFSEAAARHGLRLRQGVSEWILEVPHKFLGSPMGRALRPMLEQMQVTNVAPTNLSSGGAGAGPTFSPATPSASMAASTANPWADIPSSAATTATPVKQTTRATPLLDRQTALLSTETGSVKVCVHRLKPEREQRELLLKLADPEAAWTQPDIDAVHRYLRAVMDTAPLHATFALMLMRLLVLKQAASAPTRSSEERTRSTQHVARLLTEDRLTTLPTQSMAWCVLGNAMGGPQPPHCDVLATTDSDEPARAIDRALRDSDPPKEGVPSSSHISLRQSAAAFLYNSTLDHGKSAVTGGPDTAALSEGTMSILLGCLEHLQSETDTTVCCRHMMSVGQLLKSSKFGGTAVRLVQDLGLVDGDFGKGKEREVQDLAKEVVLLLQ